MLATAFISLALLFGAASDDPSFIWKSISKSTPGSGVIEQDHWIFSYFREAADRKARGFENIQRAGAQQEAIEALVMHCCGKPNLPVGVSKSVRRILEMSIADRWSFRVSTAGLLWVDLAVNEIETRAVAALSASSCSSMPRSSEWQLDGLVIAQNSESWLIPAALVEVTDLKDRDQVITILENRIRALVPTASLGWPAGWTKLSAGIPKANIESLSLDDLLKIARSRPGDKILWDQFIEKTKGEGFAIAGDSLRQCLSKANWPNPAPCPANIEWSKVNVDGLPSALIATIRSGGSIFCLNTQSKSETALANAAYFAKQPDLVVAERETIAACVNPDADALNLLAAIRLASESPTSNQLLQALAFSQQAIALMPKHQFAAVNKLRALKGLGMKDEARALLATFPTPPKDSWQERHIQTIRDWLQGNEIR